MFWCKKTDPFENKVKCEECRLYTDKSDAQKIKKTRTYSHPFGAYSKTKEIYYCKSHNVPYDECFGDATDTLFYFKHMEVDKDGTPVGYKKLKV